MIPLKQFTNTFIFLSNRCHNTVHVKNENLLAILKIDIKISYDKTFLPAELLLFLDVYISNYLHLYFHPYLKQICFMDRFRT